MTTHEQLVVGVDVGGTKVAAGLVDSQGKILAQVRAPMAARASATEGLACVSAALDSLFSAQPETRAAVRAIGICAPGPLDPAAGVVLNPPNLPCWHNYPVVAEAQRQFGVPVKLENDANAAALAEAMWGAGRGFQSVFYATIGTGIGTGLIFDQKIFGGRSGAAGEGGHMSVDYRGPLCGCGKPGCIEALASGPAIGRRARAALAGLESRESIIFQLADSKIDAVTPELVAQADSLGDTTARKILRETVDMLAIWLSNIIDLLEPDAIVMGGGAAALLRPLQDELRNETIRFSLNPRREKILILPAHYGADAGVAGGAALCFQTQPALSAL
jgi:glucokinase